MMLGKILSISGCAVLSIGFLMLLAWVPEETGVRISGFDRENISVFNIHKAEISKAVMLIGGTMVLAGILINILETLNATHSKALSTNKGPKGHIGNPDSSPVMSTIDHGEIVKITDRQGKERIGRQHSNGTVWFETLAGWKEFSSLQSAKDYFS